MSLDSSALQRGEAVHTFIFVGGKITLEDGTVIDTRDQDDPEIFQMIVQSEAWWSTVVSLVAPMLDDLGTSARAFSRSGMITTVNAIGDDERKRQSSVIPQRFRDYESLTDAPVVILSASWVWPHLFTQLEDESEEDDALLQGAVNLNQWGLNPEQTLCYRTRL
jgi:hypothetical protein